MIEKANKAILGGTIAALITGVITFGVYLFATLTDNQDSLSFYNDPWILFDVFLVFVLAFFIYQKSRIASSIMLIYYLFSKIYQWAVLGTFSFGILTFVFIWLFAAAVWGTFKFHQIQKRENPERYTGKKKWWIWWLVSPIVLIFTVLVGLGLFVESGYLPPIGVEAGENISDRHMRQLREADILKPDEDILYLYSPAFMSITAIGHILTEKTVITYMEEDNGEIYLERIKLSNIQDIVQITEGGALDDAEYEILTEDFTYYLTLSIDENGHEEFLKALKSRIPEYKSDNEE